VGVCGILWRNAKSATINHILGKSYDKAAMVFYLSGSFFANDFIERTWGITRFCG
jgi:hypothetical protein